MAGVGKILILMGGVFIIVGLILILAPRVPFIGKLPGDIHIERDNLEIYIPLATSILLSTILTGILWAIIHFGRK